MYCSSMAKVEHDTRTHAYQRRRFVILLYLLAITLLMTNRFEQRKRYPLEYNVFANI